MWHKNVKGKDNTMSEANRVIIAHHILVAHIIGQQNIEQLKRELDNYREHKNGSHNKMHTQKWEGDTRFDCSIEIIANQKWKASIE